MKGHPVGTKEKMSQIISARADGCISRQRKGGVPLPILYRNSKPIIDPKIIDYIAEIVAQNGSDCWFDKSILPLLREKFPNLLDKETVLGEDIMDVGLDSGVSHGSVLKFKMFSLYGDGCQVARIISYSTFLFFSIKF